jgi:hypothetical protein
MEVWYQIIDAPAQSNSSLLTRDRPGVVSADLRGAPLEGAEIPLALSAAR